MKRIKKLQKSLIEHEIDSALMIYHRDVYYYAKTARPASLAVTPDDAALFARRGTSWIIPESSVPDVREGGMSSILDWLKKKGVAKGKLGIEMDLVPANIYLRIKNEFPDAVIKDISPIVLDQRLIKDEKEIESIRGACRIVEETHRHLPKVLKDGMTELELSAELERVARLHGHETFAILRKRMDTEMPYMHILAGESTKIMGGYGQVVTGTGLSTAFPYGSSRREIRAGDVVVFDVAGMNEGYHSDLARTYCIGRAAPEILEAHWALVAIQSAMLETARPGNPASRVYETAVEKAGDLGWADYFQGHGKQRGAFVGHGLGLEVDEQPLLSPKDETVLEKNMTFTTELFIVDPDFGEVKLEDTLLVTDDIPQFLTRLEREITEI
ncbi:MAG: aminopeptidase P family protein [Candidatus Krumholzibacteria bacterium]|nr:aminopeptidase P family protein [Candidatus Krumholzibacteria bacterium]